MNIEQHVRSQRRAGWYAPFFLALLVLIWQALSSAGAIPRFLLPSPADVVVALIADFPLLLDHAGATLAEALLGLLTGIALGFSAATLMDRFLFLRQALYPLLVLTQTVPPVAIAPLLVLWLGYGMMPKIALIVIVTFFPIAVNLLNGFQSADQDTINLLRAMGASRAQIFRWVKWPSSLPAFFSALQVAVSYSVVGAVIAEWLGGYKGLGVYMTRVRKSYAFDKMFAVIFLISLISLLCMALVKRLKTRAMPWINIKPQERNPLP